MMMNTQFSSIAATGPDAFDFLQSQLSNDLRLLAHEPVLLSAWCNPKGRVICMLRVRRIDDGYELILPDELADSVIERLKKFRFRARVTLERRSCTLDQIGVEVAPGEWLLDNLRQGIPDIRRAQSEAFTPHMLNLDLLGAVSFDKGCYPGQEIVARTHYRGASRRRMRRFESERPAQAGDEVADGERKVGDVVNAIGNELLAVVPVAAAESKLFVNGAPIRLLPLPYDSVEDFGAHVRE